MYHVTTTNGFELSFILVSTETNFLDHSFLNPFLHDREAILNPRLIGNNGAESSKFAAPLSSKSGDTAFKKF